MLSLMQSLICVVPHLLYQHGPRCSSWCSPQYVLSPFCHIYVVPDAIPDMCCPQFIEHADNADTTNEGQQNSLVEDMGMTGRLGDNTGGLKVTWRWHRRLGDNIWMKRIILGMVWNVTRFLALGMTSGITCHPHIIPVSSSVIST